LFVSVYFLSVLHLQYQHILLTSVYVLRWNFKKTMISGACTNNGSKIKLSANRGHITFPWIWGLTGITFARRKSITIARKIYLRLFFYICYLEYIWFTHNIFCILQHDWRCNMDYSPFWSAFKMKTKNIRIASIIIWNIFFVKNSGTYMYIKKNWRQRIF
jgi:hypothetical protein